MLCFFNTCDICGKSTIMWKFLSSAIKLHNFFSITSIFSDKNPLFKNLYPYLK